MNMRTFVHLLLGLFIGFGSTMLILNSSRPAMASSTARIQDADAADSLEPAEAPPLLVAGRSMTVDLDSASISLTLETERPESGVPIVFRLTVTDAADQILELPRPGEVLGPFEVLDGRRLADAAASNLNPLPPRLTLRTFDAGRLELPPITVRLGATTMTFPARSIEVESVAGLDAGPENFRDIADAVTVRAPFDWRLVSMVVAGSIAILAILAFFWWRARLPRPLPPPEPADRWALSALDRLASRQLPLAGEIEPFFTELTDIARGFIERRFHIAAPERTTQEFITEARTHPELTTEQAQRLARLLRTADLVKFAGDRPMVTECDKALEVTRGFVVEAGPNVEVDETTAGDATVSPGSPRTRNHGTRESAIHRAVDGLDDLEGRT